MKKIVRDTTDAFDRRLDELQAGHAPPVEIDSATTIYERLLTAQTICASLVPGAYSETAVFSLLQAISDEVALRRSIDSDEGDDD